MDNDDRTLRINGDLVRGEQVTITVDDQPVDAYLGETVAAALWAVGIRALSHSAQKKEARGMYCGMGVCFGCRVTINGVPNVLACQTTVAKGMRIQLQEGHGKWEQ